MSKPSVFGTVLFADEAAWGENVHTWDGALAIRGAVDASGLDQQMIRSERTVQYMSDDGGYYPGVMGGSFSTQFFLPGHGTPTDAAVSLTEHETIMKYAVGNATPTANGTTINDVSTVTSLEVALASGYNAGDIIFVGVHGDGRGEGQAAVVASHAAGTVTLATALPGAPQNGDVVYGATMIHPFESPANSNIQPTRWGLVTANASYEAHGCYPTSLALEGTNTNEALMATVGWGVSWFEDSTEAFPSATEPTWDTPPAANAAGSLFLQDYGDSTRAEYDVRSFRITTDLGIIAESSPGGVGQFQGVTGAVRGAQMTTIEIVIDAPAKSASPEWVANWLSILNYADAHWHLLYTFNSAGSGKRAALYAPRMCLSGARPVQVNDGGINRIRLTFRCKPHVTKTTDLVASAWRLALG